jgi:hypothetical protein
LSSHEFLAFSLKSGDPPIKQDRIIESNFLDGEKGLETAIIHRPVYDRANAFRIKNTLPFSAEQAECQIRLPGHFRV